MTALTLKNLPPKLLRALRAAAEHDRRSLTQEVIHLLELALHHRVERPDRVAFDAASQLTAWRKLAGTWQSDLEPALEAERVMASRTPGRKVEL
jgi:plasmid stability protein